MSEQTVLPRLIVILLLSLGVVCWVTFRSFIDAQTIGIASVVLLVLLIPPVRRWATDVLDRIRRPSWRSANWAAVGVTIVAALVLYELAARQGRPFIPTYHDEHVYLIQMQMLARGRLWMPQHPMADFFETFHMFVKPVYAGIYFPGTSLLYVPTAWLNLPYWFMPLLVAGAVVGMTYRVLTELVDGVAGLLGGLVLFSLRPFRLVSIMMLGHPVMMLWSLLSIWTWLLWRRQQRPAWALLLGIIVGWAAITRPLDALCFAVPVGAGILWDLRGKTIGHWLATLGLAAAGTVPFLIIQLTANHGITGHLLETPYQNYLARNYPGIALGFATFNPEWQSQSDLRQKQAYYKEFIAPTLRTHTAGAILPTLYRSRVPTMLQAGLSDAILLILVPVGILGLTDSRRWVVWSTLPIFMGAYVCFPGFPAHYALAAALPLALMLVLGIRVVAENWPRQQRAIGTILTLVVASFVLTAMPGLRQSPSFPEGGAWPVITAVHKLLPTAVQAPAVVLFPYRPGDNFHEEPVYNVDVAWPDDAPIIRVQDLGLERDQEIAAYYAKTQPDRNFYVFDRRNGSVHFLGKPNDVLAFLEAKLAGEPATTPGPGPSP